MIESKPWRQDLFSKIYSAHLLAKFVEKYPAKKGAWTPVPFIANSLTALTSWIEDSEYESFVIKEEYSFAGRGRRFLTKHLGEKDEQWLKAAFCRQPTLRCEPFWKERVDLSLVFEVSETRVRPSLLRQICSQHGRYLGHQIGSLFWDLDRDWQVNLLHKKDGRNLVQESLFDAAHFVADHLRDLGYRGPAGIDAFLARDCEGNFYLSPICELNLRWTFGHLARAWTKIARLSGKKGLWMHYRLPDLQKRGFWSFTDFYRHLVDQNERKKGFHLFTTDPFSAEVSLSVLHANDESFINPALY